MFTTAKRLAKRVFPKAIVGHLAYALHRGKRTYSQFGEDILVGKLLPESNGFYVDIGAFHPKYGSNTYRLWQRGWNGINVDVDDYKVRLFNHYRANDTNILTGVSNSNEVRSFYVQAGESYGSMSSLERDFAVDRAGRNSRDLVERQIRVTTFADLLDRHVPKLPDGSFRRIDFVNMDVEGHELPILQSLDFGRFRPRCWCIEIHADTLSDLRENAAFELLKSQGYELVAWPAPSCIFFDQRQSARAGCRVAA